MGSDSQLAFGENWGMSMLMNREWNEADYRGNCPGGCPDPPCRINYKSLAVIRFVPPWLTHRHTQRQTDSYYKLSR